MTNENARKWYQKKRIILPLVLFFPPLAIPLIWLSRWSRSAKIGTTVLSGLILIAMIAGQSETPQTTSLTPASPSTSPFLPPAPSVSLSPSPSPTPSASVVPEQISGTGAGLGDTREGFEKRYGSSASSNKESGRYMNDLVQADYADDRIHTISLNSRKTDTNKSGMTREEAIELAQPYFPDDAVKIKEWQSSSNEYAIHYESKKLANVFSSKWQEVFWGEGVKPGSFLVILTHEEGNQDDVFSAIISAGDPDNP